MFSFSCCSILTFFPHRNRQWFLQVFAIILVPFGFHFGVFLKAIWIIFVNFRCCLLAKQPPTAAIWAKFTWIRCGIKPHAYAYAGMSGDFASQASVKLLFKSSMFQSIFSRLLFKSSIFQSILGIVYYFVIDIPWEATVL